MKYYIIHEYDFIKGYFDKYQIPRNSQKRLIFKGTLEDYRNKYYMTNNKSYWNIKERDIIEDCKKARQILTMSIIE